MTLKPGQTVRVGNKWGTISYFIGNNKAVVMLDDLYLVQVRLENLKVAGQGRAGQSRFIHLPFRTA